MQSWCALTMIPFHGPISQKPPERHCCTVCSVVLKHSVRTIRRSYTISSLGKIERPPVLFLGQSQYFITAFYLHYSLTLDYVLHHGPVRGSLSSCAHAHSGSFGSTPRRITANKTVARIVMTCQSEEVSRSREPACVTKMKWKDSHMRRLMEAPKPLLPVGEPFSTLLIARTWSPLYPH